MEILFVFTSRSKFELLVEDIILFTMDKSAGSDREPRMECGTGRLAEILTHWSLHAPGRGNNDHKVFTDVCTSNDPL